MFRLEARRMAGRLSWNLRWRLSVLWFLEWGITGAVMTYLPVYWKSIRLSESQSGQLYAVTAVGLWVAPFVVGQLADRWMSIERILSMAHFVGGVTLYALAGAMEFYEQTAGNFETLRILVGLFAVAYFPTVPLVSVVCFRHLSDPEAQFGKVRVWGTVGWMLAGVVWSLWLGRVQALAWLTVTFPDLAILPNLEALALWLPRPAPSDCFRMSALLSFGLAAFAVFLPHTPPARTARDKVALLGLFSMFRDRTFSLFLLISFLLAVLVIPLYALAVPVLLQGLGVQEDWVPAVMIVGQISEFPALWALSFCLRRLGPKLTFALGIGAWASRYAFFAAGAPWWLVFAGLSLHGVCHVFLIIVAQLYIDSVCRKDLRASAQNLLSFITLGIGMPLGALLGGEVHGMLAEHTAYLFALPAVFAVGLLVLFWKTVHFPTGREITAPDPSPVVADPHAPV
jgi:MFS family permease